MNATIMTYAVFCACLAAALSGVCILRKSKLRFDASEALRRVTLAGSRAESRAKESGLFRRFRQQKAESEISEAVSFMRNIIAIEKGRRVTAEYILTRLAEKDGVLRHAFAGMISRLRMNEKEEAVEAFAAESGTPMGREFAAMIIHWDDADPADLAEILLSHQKTIRETRATRQRRRDETVSDLIYLPVVFNVFLVFINFLYVSFFLQQQEMFSMLFA